MKLKVCGLQIGTFEQGDTAETYLEKHVALLERAVAEEAEKPGGKPYICLFPETMTNAYFGGVVDPKWFACFEDARTGVTTRRMHEEAQRLGVHIAYSFCEKAVERGAPHYYNTVGLMSPTRGLIGIYRKTHISAIDTDTMQVHEPYYFEPGPLLTVYRLDNGLPVGILICYDRSFSPAWQCLYLQGAQLVLVSACSWGFRGAFFQQELQCRAFETHTFVVAVNRAGDERVENEVHTRNQFGKSMVAGPLGEKLASLEDEKWSYVAAEVDFDEIDQAHRVVNLKRDRRPDLYGIVSASGNFCGEYIHTHNKL